MGKEAASLEVRIVEVATCARWANFADGKKLNHIPT
jgi:hypothetical protein